jgi:hypothetical protein
MKVHRRDVSSGVWESIDSATVGILRGQSTSGAGADVSGCSPLKAVEGSRWPATLEWLSLSAPDPGAARGR